MVAFSPNLSPHHVLRGCRGCRLEELSSTFHPGRALLAVEAGGGRPNSKPPLLDRRAKAPSPP